ncbi:MAG: (d)CMP kinase [Bacteroidales bacterium]|nr:(d)CMP kinase [Bacteroidales bacterium]
MNLKDILAISGEGTLFKFIAQGKNAVIVENLETGRRLSAGATAKVSALEEIAIFTTGEDLPLGKVMDRIWEKENGGEAVSHKLPDAELKIFMTASVEIRAKRRYDELASKGIKTDIDEVKRNIIARDIADENRDISPLRRADDALVLDNSRMSVAGQMEWIMNIIETRLHDS